jgi:hypothetical protein
MLSPHHGYVIAGQRSLRLRQHDRGHQALARWQADPDDALRLARVGIDDGA